MTRLTGFDLPLRTLDRSAPARRALPGDGGTWSQRLYERGAAGGLHRPGASQHPPGGDSPLDPTGRDG